MIPHLYDVLDRDPAIGAARSRRLLEEDAVALDAIARERLPAAFGVEDRLSRSQLQEMPQALVRRALTAWLSGHGILSSISAPALDLLIQSIRGGEPSDRHSAGASFVCVDQTDIWIEEDRVEDPLESARLVFGECLELSTGWTLGCEWIKLDEETRRTVLSGEVDPSHEAFIALPASAQLDVRAWMPGDRYKPLGAPGGRKLKEWFIDRHVPRRERCRLPIVLNEVGEILWVPGFAPAESAKIRPSTKQALKLTYRRGNSR